MEKNVRKIDTGPRPEMGKKWPKKGEKMEFGIIFLVFAIFGPFFSHFRPWAIFYFRPIFFHFRLSARFPFYTRRRTENTGEDEAAFTREELDAAIDSLEHNKSPGPDERPAEVHKALIGEVPETGGMRFRGVQFQLSAPKSQRFLRFAIAMPMADPRNRAISETRESNAALRFKGAMESR